MPFAFTRDLFRTQANDPPVFRRVSASLQIDIHWQMWGPRRYLDSFIKPPERKLRESYGETHPMNYQPGARN